MTHSTISKRTLPAMIVLGALALGGCSGTNVGDSWQCPLAQGGTCDSVAGADPAVPRAASAPRAAPVPQAASVPDAAPADGMTIRAPLYRVRGGGPREAAAPPCEAGCGFDPFGWLIRLFGADGGEKEPGTVPTDSAPQELALPMPANSRTAAAETESPAVDAPVPAVDAPVPAVDAPVPAVDAPVPAGAAPVPADDDPGSDRRDDDLRTGEVVARIWIAPFVDANGVYREASHVRVVLEPAGWRLP